MATILGAVLRAAASWTPRQLQTVRVRLRVDPHDIGRWICIAFRPDIVGSALVGGLVVWVSCTSAEEDVHWRFAGADRRIDQVPVHGGCGPWAFMTENV